ncbi:Uncharacterised protein [Shigella sonnei]|nr:Uncharacterised protein [Shigella sonnei]
MTANLHHFVFWHALTHCQAINRYQTSNQNRGKRMTNKLEPFVSGRAFWHKTRGNGFQPHQHQRQQDQRQAESERWHFTFAEMRLVDVVRNMQLNVTADEVTPQRPGNNHSRNCRTQANQDHPAKIGVHLRCQQHWRWPWHQERRRCRHACE